MDCQTLKNIYTEHYRPYNFTVLPSSLLVNKSLPTAFVMSVGLLQLKPILTEESEISEWHDFTMIQRCIRHYDIESVGYNNHLSFFEMAGSITAGSRPVDEIIELLLNLLFNELGFSRDKIFFTVFGGGKFNGTECQQDVETLAALRKMGIVSRNIFMRGIDENFFGTAPREEYCGNSLEVFVDRGTSIENNSHKCMPGCPCGRFIEIGNTVFLRYKKENGGLRLLPKVYGESALGIERTVMTLSHYATIYELPELQRVRETLTSEFQIILNAGDAQLNADICTDHLRAITFAIADGALPGHGGRRQVLRKIIRRFVARLGVSKTDTNMHKGLEKALSSLAISNRHIMNLTTHQMQNVISIIEDENAIFENGTADPSNYLKEVEKPH